MLFAFPRVSDSVWCVRYFGQQIGREPKMGSVKKSKFDIIRVPVITEKAATLGSANNTVVFEVHPDANKHEIKQAVEKLFDVTVIKVRTARALGKVKRVKTSIGRQVSWKKAYISLKQGDAINVIEGL